MTLVGVGIRHKSIKHITKVAC